MNDLITIAIALYNNESYVSKCMNSVKSQIYSYLEVLIINDGSTDKSVDKCKVYLNDERFILVNKSNEGLSSSRQLALEMAKGSYICFIDADDYLLPNYVEDLYRKITDDGSDIAICSTLFKTEDDVILKSDTNNFHIDERLPLKVGNDLFNDFSINYSEFLHLSDSWNKMYSVAFLRKTGVCFSMPKGMNGTDLVFNHKVYLHYPKYSFTSNVGYVHVNIMGSAVHRKNKQLLNTFQNVIKQLIKEATKIGNIDLIWTKLSILYATYMLYGYSEAAIEAKSLVDFYNKFQDCNRLVDVFEAENPKLKIVPSLCNNSTVRYFAKNKELGNIFLFSFLLIIRLKERITKW